MTTRSTASSKMAEPPGPCVEDRGWRAGMRASRDWLSRRHSIRAEALTAAVLYVAYEVSRGITVGDANVALHHARQVAHVERSLSIFVERDVQVVARSIPGLLGVSGVAYLALHLTVAIGFLAWVYRCRPWAFPVLRNTFWLATVLGMIGYVAFPTAPPRLAGMGIVDTVSSGYVDLDAGLVHSLYNPFAAMPSMHFGYAVIVAASAVVLARHRVGRVAGAAYPALILFVIVATGNHFLLDAVAGGLMAGAAGLGALWLTRSSAALDGPAHDDMERPTPRPRGPAGPLRDPLAHGTRPAPTSSRAPQHPSRGRGRPRSLAGPLGGLVFGRVLSTTRADPARSR